MVKSQKSNRKISPTTPKKITHKTVGTVEDTPKGASGKTGGKKEFKAFKKPKVIQGSITPKKRRFKNVMKEIKYFQKNIGFLIPHAKMVKIVKEITNEGETFPLRFTSTSFDVLQEAFEAYVVRIFEYANLVARHAKRVTIFPSDINLVLRIKNGT